MHVAKERVYMDESYVASHTLPVEYPEFNALVFSIDTLIPFVDLHQETYWEPASDGWVGGGFRFYLWLHIIAGWVFTTVAVAGFTGLIKKD
jgi:hypothetical protein